MKFGAVVSIAAVACSSFVSPQVRAAGADDIYLDAYQLIQEADKLGATGRSELARQRYLEAREDLKKLQTTYPNYSKGAVDYRLEYVQDKINALPAPKEEAKPQSPAQPGPAPQAAQGTQPAGPNAADQIKALNEQVARLQGENSTLEAKLKEALAPQPAAVDPRELAKAEERIKELEKEKELLRASAEQAKAQKPEALDLEQMKQTQAELANTKKQLVESVANVASLSQENQRLQQQLAAASSAPAAPAGNENSKIKSLEKERDGLMKKLNDANKELYDVKARGQAAQMDTLTNELSNLRSRLEVFEARKVPFTPEEMALLDKSGPKQTRPASSNASAGTKQAKRPKELPSGAGPLVAKAEAAFAAHRYADAESDYQQVLKMDENNPLTLENLAAIQLQLQKFDAANANLNKALAIQPDDAYALSLMGMLRVQQGMYEQALDVLSRSAQLDPKNPETENYLGITLSQQGQREAAETALRRAITLNPNYADAHVNLAVIYATAKPPFMELAKYHYNKALSLGQPPNPELEKELASGSSNNGSTTTPASNSNASGK